MDENVIKIIKEKFDSLPRTIQEAILSSDYENTLATISQQNNLTLLQRAALEKEATLVMMGLIPTQNFAISLMQELATEGIDETKAGQIAKDINEQIFFKVWDELQLLNNNQNTQTGPIPTKATASPTTFIKKDLPENKLIENNLDARFAGLPKDIQRAVEESEYETKIYAISQQHSLTVEQIGKLEAITVDVMLGKTPGNKFEEVLQNALGISADKSLEIVTAVNSKVLKNIREKMMAIPMNTPSTLATINELELPAGHPEHPEVLESREDLLKQLENPIPAKEIPKPPLPILEQKLAGPVQVASTETTHTLENISKNSEIVAPKAPTSYPPKADPYRLSPDQ